MFAMGGFCCFSVRRISAVILYCTTGCFTGLYGPKLAHLSQRNMMHPHHTCFIILPCFIHLIFRLEFRLFEKQPFLGFILQVWYLIDTDFFNFWFTANLHLHLWPDRHCSVLDGIFMKALYLVLLAFKDNHGVVLPQRQDCFLI